MKKRVLITGASGFIGYHLIIAALEQGFEVYAAVRAGSEINHLKAFDIQFVELDFGNIGAIQNNLLENQYNYIIHAAGITRAIDEHQYMEVNTFLTRNICAAIIRSRVSLDKFILISSLAAGGPSASLKPIEETDESRPITAYGRSKLRAEQIVLKMSSIPSIILRPTAVYGPRERQLLKFLKLIKNGLEIYIGSTDQKLSFIHVSDLAEVTMCALKSDLTNVRFNVSDGFLYDRYALARIAKQQIATATLKVQLPGKLVSLFTALQDRILSLSGKAALINSEKILELTAGNWSCSVKHLMTKLSFQPRFDLCTGMKDTIAWYKQHRWL